MGMDMVTDYCLRKVRFEAGDLELKSTGDRRQYRLL